MTKAQLLKFIKMRNRSEYNSNMQFQSDAEDCGFNARDLGDVVKDEHGDYVWTTPHGKLREHWGVLSLEP